MVASLLELGADQNSTVVFPLPMDIVGPLVRAVEKFTGDDEPPAKPPKPLSVVDRPLEG